MAAEPSNKPAHDQLESLIDGLIRDILNEAEAPAPSGRGRASTLMETAMAAAPSSPMALEKLLLAEAFASALADAIAPAMAAALAPRIVTVLERTMPSQPAGKRPLATATSNGGGRKPGARR